MDRPTLILIRGLVLAGIIIGIGAIGEAAYERRAAKHVAECEDSNRARSGLPGMLGDPLVCEPNELRWSPRAPGIQGDIQASLSNADRWSETALSLGLLVGFFGAIPYVWYFLLRRVREVRNALMGRDITE